MTHTCCSVCRLRLAPTSAAGVGECPSCDGPLTTIPASAALGFRLVALDPALSEELARSAELPVPDGRP